MRSAAGLDIPLLTSCRGASGVLQRTHPVATNVDINKRHILISLYTQNTQTSMNISKNHKLDSSVVEF